MKKLLEYFSKESPVSQNEAYLYATLFVFLSALSEVSYEWSMFKGTVIGMKLRIACGCLIYKHCLKLQRRDLGSSTIGQVINLFSNDLKRLDNVCRYLPFLVLIVPVKIIIATYYFDVWYGHVTLTLLVPSIISSVLLCKCLFFHIH